MEWIVKNKKGEEKKILVRNSTIDELGLIIKLQKKVFLQIENPDLFALTDEEQLKESLKEDCCVSLYEKKQLIGFALLIVNRDTPRHGAWHIKSKIDNIEKTVTVDSIFIDGEYRGYGLQQKIFEEFEKWAKNHGISTMVTTISPENSFSLNNGIRNGYQIVETKALYGGKTRHILKKTL